MNLLNLPEVSELTSPELSNVINFRKTRHRALRAFLSVLLLLLALPAGCRRDSQPTVVVYTSVDQTLAQRVLAGFQQQTGIRVQVAYDTEAGKTTGFLKRLARERTRPRADVWWSSEVFGTIELARSGVLEAYRPPPAADIPDAWKDPDGFWTAIAARARVLAYDPARIAPDQLPRTWRDLPPRQRLAQTAIAMPLFGTTRGHLAAMFAYWGTDAATATLQKLRVGEVLLADGNAHVVRLIASGRAIMGWTDTDDVWAARQRGQRIELAYLPLDEELPPVWVPNTIARVRGGPHPDAARELIDFLVSEQVERMIYESASRNVPLRPALREAVGYDGPTPEPLDQQRIADAVPEAMAATRRILLH